MRIAKFRGVWPLTLCLSLESIDRLGAAISGRVIRWRRDFHQNPERSDPEFGTAALVAEHLAGLGPEAQTGVAQYMDASAEVRFPWPSSCPITCNDPDLTACKWPSPSPGAEDFSFFANEVPGLYISLGGKPRGVS